MFCRIELGRDWYEILTPAEQFGGPWEPLPAGWRFDLRASVSDPSTMRRLRDLLGDLGVAVDRMTDADVNKEVERRLDERRLFLTPCRSLPRYELRSAPKVEPIDMLDLLPNRGQPADAPSPGAPQAEPPQESSPAASPAPSRNLWYELRVVDELGQGIPDVPVSLMVSGSPRRLTTDGDGRVRVDDATTGFARASLPEVEPLRDALRPRWEQIREGDWLDDAEDHSYLDCAEPLPSVSVEAERVHTIVVQPRITCARMIEMLFETNKVFLLPSALTHIRSIISLYRRRPRADLLIVGHADVTGDPDVNDPLSLERAKSVKAYLCDDVDAWLEYYGEGMPAAARWGPHEDRLMLDAVLAASGAQPDDPVRHFQETHGLVPDGKLGPNTRRALITEYMAFDGTSLPEGIEPAVHGCGENFPLDDGGRARDRRVELFFFDGALGILPPPPGENSGPGSAEYPEWHRRSIETHDFEVGGDELDLHLSDLHFMLTNRSGGLPLPDRSIEIDLPAGTQSHTTDPDGIVLVQATPPGDYEVVVRLGDHEDRFLVPSVPAGVEALSIPVDLPLEA